MSHIIYNGSKFSLEEVRGGFAWITADETVQLGPTPSYVKDHNGPSAYYIGYLGGALEELVFFSEQDAFDAMKPLCNVNGGVIDYHFEATEEDSWDDHR